MSGISLQEIILVLLAAIVIITYHAHLYIQVRRDPLKTAIGIGNHARQKWVRGIMRDNVISLQFKPFAIKLMPRTFLL